MVAALTAACLIKLTVVRRGRGDRGVHGDSATALARRDHPRDRDWHRDDHRDGILLRDVWSRVPVSDLHLPFHEGPHRFAIGDGLSARDPRHPASAVRDRMHRGEARGSHQFRLDVGARDGGRGVPVLRHSQPDLMGAQLSRGAAVHHDHRRHRRRLDDRRKHGPHRKIRALAWGWPDVRFIILISLLWIAPLENENWMQGSVYGFGFVPREEVSRIGARCTMRAAPTRTSSRRHSSPSRPIGAS